MKRILSIAALLMFLGVFLAADIGYAAAPKGKTEQADEEAQGRTGKKSVLAGIETLLWAAKFSEGEEFTTAEYRGMREEYSRTGNAEWTISDSMITQELNDMIMLGLIERVSRGNYVVRVAMDVPQKNLIDGRFGREVPSLTKTDGERENKPIGLNSWNLTDKSDDEKATMIHKSTWRQILSEP